MDLHLKQWKRHQHQEDESEDQHTQSAKFPKLLLPPHPQQLHNNNNKNKDRPPPLSSSSSSSAVSTLPLFVPDHPPLQPSNSSSSSSPSPRMGGYFSLAQWQELELQALIYRYMLSGDAIPPELLHPIKNSLAHQSPLFLQQNHPHLSYFLHYPHSQPFRFQSGYWGRGSMDPEPGRCRRTDGKKWRCSRDVVPGQKYCERHVHRGRNRSRKPVENSAPPGTCAAAAATAAATNSTDAVTVASLGSVASGSHLGISGSSQPPIDLFQMNKRLCWLNYCCFWFISFVLRCLDSDKASHSGPITGARAQPSGSQVLRHFFDDWPRTLQEHDVGSLTGLSMSIAGNPSSDVSLKLSTGDGETDRTRGSNWLTGWSSSSRVTSVGGPLAEALRSSATTTDHSSPTSVLHRLPCGLAAETGLMTLV